MSSRAKDKEPTRAVIISANRNVVAVLSDSLASVKQDPNPIILAVDVAPEALERLREASKDRKLAVLVDLAEQQPALDLIRLCSSLPGVLAIGVGTVKSDKELILATLRAGASDYLAPPFELQEFKECFQRWTAEHEERPSRRLICFLPAVDGSGASVTSLHVAHAVSSLPQQRVLLVDLDFHTSALAFRLRLQPGFTLADAVQRRDVIDDLWGQVVSSWNGLHVMPPPTSSSVLTPEQLQFLPAVLASAAAVYSCIVVDLPSAIHRSSSDVLSNADSVYLVCTPEVTSLHLANRKKDELLELGVPEDSLKLVVNRAGGGRLPVRQIARAVGLPVTWTLGNDYSELTEACAKATLVRSESALGRQYHQLACHMLGIETAVAKSPKKLRDLLSTKKNSRDAANADTLFGSRKVLDVP